MTPKEKIKPNDGVQFHRYCANVAAVDESRAGVSEVTLR